MKNYYSESLIKLGASKENVDAFINFHKSNPEIWEAFEKIALNLIEEGFNHYGTNAILEIVRYKLRKKTKSGYKCNNNHAPLYARIFSLKHPDNKDFFEFRELKNKR